MTSEEVIRKTEKVLKQFLNCEIESESKTHADAIVLAEVPTANYHFNLLDLPNEDVFVNIELAESSSSDETAEIEIDLSFCIASENDYFRALRYREALLRVLRNHGRDEWLDFKIEGKSIQGLNRGSLKRYLVSCRVSVTTI